MGGGGIESHKNELNRLELDGIGRNQTESDGTRPNRIEQRTELNGMKNTRLLFMRK